MDPDEPNEFLHNGARMWDTILRRSRSSDELQEYQRTVARQDLANFFPSGARGVRQWMRIFDETDGVETPFQTIDRTSLERLSRGQANSKRFRRAKKDVVFLSHSYSDTPLAEDLAREIKHNTKFDVWLDVWDPILTALPHLIQTDAQKALLIAHTIEIGLLNSDAVLAVYTSNAPGSLWIPYEYGRIKSRRFYAHEAVAAIHVPTSDLPEYMLLSDCFAHDIAATDKLNDLGNYRGLKTWFHSL